jgi:16S rRNA (uracil1498-N3)-methyltransferase
MIAPMGDKKTKARLFVNNALKATVKITATIDQAHYLLKVMRVKNGDHVTLFNGCDGEWTSVIGDVSKKNCTFQVGKQLKEQLAEPDLWLAFAPLKKSNTDFIIEKASELGVSRLIPVFTEHTNTTRVKSERLRLIAIEAAEQCDRLSVAQVIEPVTFAELVDQWPEQRGLLVPDETGGGETLKSALNSKQKSLHGFLIGPEGGFAQSELDALGNLPFVTLVGLGPRILRAETAALAALACYQAITGDWDQKPRFKNGHIFNASR